MSPPTHRLSLFNLPVELIPLILQHLPRRELKSYALVHSSWTQPAQRLLFTDLSISLGMIRPIPKAEVKFSDRLARVSELFSYTTHLYLASLSLDDTGTNALGFSHNGHDQVDLLFDRTRIHFAGHTLRELSALLPNLSRLTLSYWPVSLFKIDVLLHVFAGVTAVAFSGVRGQSPDFGNALCLLPRHVVELALDDRCCRYGLQGWASVPSPPLQSRFQTLFLESIKLLDTLYLLDERGFTSCLRCLDLTIKPGYNTPAPQRGRLRMDHLHELRVEFCFRPVYDPLRTFWLEYALAAWLPITQQALHLTVAFARISTILPALDGLDDSNIQTLRVEVRQDNLQPHITPELLFGLDKHVELPSLTRVDILAVLHHRRDAFMLLAAFDAWSQRKILTSCISFTDKMLETQEADAS